MVIVTGGSGLLGKSLKKLKDDYLYVSSKDVNLMDVNKTNDYLNHYKPNTIIHMAGRVGGIRENNEKPYQFIHENNVINTNIIDYCVRNNTRIVYISSTCVYPKDSDTYPMTEDMVDYGNPESTNDSYAYAKRFGAYMLRSAKRQYNLDYCILYFCNLYGEYDDFSNENKSHLVTALIKKFHEAKIKNLDEVCLWGSGNPLRQFMYSGDAAKIILEVVERNISGEYNFAIPDNLSVLEIAKIVRDVVGYSGKITFNGKLDGVYRKDVCSNKLLDKVGKINFISLREGVEKTYKCINF
jgi:GDP-L-fucose synthase